MNSTIRTAVLLVAGTGSRLRPLTNDIPKALVPLDEETVLHRIVRQLNHRGISRFVLATGYREQALKDAMAAFSVEVEYCRNDAFESTQNSISLLGCAEALAGEPFVKLDGDLVVRDAVLDALLADSSPMSVAVDTSRSLDQEAMKVDIGENHFIRDFGKSLSLSIAAAESIGIEKLDARSAKLVLGRIRELRDGGTTNKYYEDVYADLIREGSLVAKAVDVAGIGWSEIDTFEDLDAARALLSAETVGAR